MAYEFRARRIVEFAETDMAGIVHFSNFFRYMEATEHAFFRALGVRVHSEPGGPDAAWGFARREASCDYRAPLRNEDTVELHLMVAEKRSRGIRYVFDFYRVEPHGEGELLRHVATGSMAVVCAARDAAGMLTAVPLPAVVEELLEVAPPELLAARGGRG